MSRRRRTRLQLGPVAARVASARERRLPQPLVGVLEHERLPAAVDRRLVAVEQRVACGSHGQRELAFADREERAGRESDEIGRVRNPARLVDVVYAPDQPSVFVAPRAEVFEMKIANPKHARRVVERGAAVGPDLYPPVKRAPQEDERAFAHALVLSLQIADYHARLTAQPAFVRTGALDERAAIRGGAGVVASDGKGDYPAARR